jgi:tRNA A-37 threonylcarbamoyl transferase component Bud32
MCKTLNFKKLRSRYQPADAKTLQAFLCEIFSDLSNSPKNSYMTNSTNKERTIDKDIFIKYIGLPYLIGERIFTHLAKSTKNTLKLKDFVEGLTKLYNGNLSECREIIFGILDFDKDGFIVAHDVRLFLSFLYSKKEGQAKTFNKIDRLIDNFFKDVEYMSFDIFINLVDNKNSNIFFLLICFLYENKFYDEGALEIYVLDKDRIEAVLTDYYSNYNKSPRNKQLMKEELAAPTQLKGYFGIQTDFDNFLPEEILRDDKMEEELKELEGFEVGEIALKPMVTQHGINFIDHINGCNNNFELDELKSSSQSSSSTNSSTSVYKSIKISMPKSDDDISFPEGEFEGYGYNLTNEKNKFWLVLVGRDLFYFKNNNKTKLQGLHNLSNSFLVDGVKEVVRDDKKFYCFSIIFPRKERVFGFKRLEQCNAWLDKLKSSMNYRCIDDYFKLNGAIGKGTYGIVKTGHCKQTGQPVAIKIIEKELYEDQIGLVRNELEILKFCKHANIVGYIDSFETPQHIYIVTEYLDGGNLKEFLKFHSFSIHENRVRHIIKQIALGVEYLHHYGILHRDLKPMNIMVSDLGLCPKVKIIDFGFSKVLGQNELANDMVGSIHCIAPEVLERKKYNSKIDIWSLGVILYDLLLGEFPFDDEEQNEVIIANKIVKGKYVMPLSRTPSFTVKSLILSCIKKDISTRINIEDFLGHPWFQA